MMKSTLVTRIAFKAIAGRCCKLAVIASAMAGFLTNESAQAASLFWGGDAGATWDVGITAAWTNGTSQSVFANGDSVLFNQLAVAKTLSVAGTVAPASIAISNSTAYILNDGGSGVINCAGNLSKGGSAAATINVDLTAASTTITNNTLNIGSPNAASLGPVTFANGAVLRFPTVPSMEITNTAGFSGTGAVQVAAAVVLNLQSPSKHTNGASVAFLVGSGSTVRARATNALGLGVAQLGSAQLDTSSLVLDGNSLVLSNSAFNVSVRSGGFPSTAQTQPAAHIINLGGTNQVLHDGSSTPNVATGGNNYTLESQAGLLIHKKGVSNSSGTDRHCVLRGAGDGRIDGPLTSAASVNWIKVGSGTWTLMSSNLPNRPFRIYEGTLALGPNGSFPTASGCSMIEVHSPVSYTFANPAVPAVFDVSQTAAPWSPVAGQSLRGLGVVKGNVVATNGTIQPGTISGTGFAYGPANPLYGVLSFSNNLTINGATLTYDLSNDPTNGVNDSIVVAGNLTLTSGTITVNFLNAVLGSGEYVLISYGGTFSGNPANIAINGAPGATLIHDAAAKQIRLVFSPTAPLTWVGGQNNVWDLNGATNWTPDAGVTFSKFTNTFLATFDDTSLTQNIAVVGTILPGVVNFNNSSLPYTLNGSGKISGACQLNKAGAADLGLYNTNCDFTASVSLSGGGVVEVSKLANGGQASSIGASSSSSVNLKLNNVTLRYVGSANALTDRGAQLEGATTIEVTNPAVSLQFGGSVTGTGNQLTKTGPGKLILAANNTFGQSGIGDSLFVNEGSVQCGNGGTAGDFGSSRVNLADGTTLIWNRSDDYVNGLQSLTAGAGRVIKTGTGSYGVAGQWTHTGGTIISNGVIYANRLEGSGAIEIWGGTLSGDSRAYGGVTNHVGGKISPGTANAGVGSIATLNLGTGNLTLEAGSTVLMDINKATNQRDQIANIGTVTFGGTLKVTNLSGTLSAGSSYTLFAATTYQGNFAATNLPPLGNGLGWNWSPTNGVLSVVQTINLTPTNITTSVSGSTLSLSWPTDHTGWILQSQTNQLAVGLGANWTDISSSATTNQVDLPIVPSNQAVFFRLRTP